MLSLALAACWSLSVQETASLGQTSWSAIPRFRVFLPLSTSLFAIWLIQKNAQFQKLVTFQITSFTELLVTPQHILNVTSVISCLLLTEIIGTASRQSSAEDQDQEDEQNYRIGMKSLYVKRL